MTLRRISVTLGLSFVAVSAAAQTTINQLPLPAETEGATWQVVASDDADTLWLGSDMGHVAYSTDRGENWTVSQPMGRSSSLAITQIRALGDREAYVLTSGRGADSRLYHSRNSGFSWNRSHRANGDETLLCFDAVPDGEAWILGASRNDDWHVVRSTNGRTWLSSRSGFDKSAEPGERGFNESGSCVRYANNTWAMGSAYAQQARLMFKSSSALRFRVVSTPIEGPAPAITAVWPLGTNDILFTGGSAEPTATSEQASQVFRYHNNEFSTLPQAPLSGILTSLVKYQGHMVVGNSSGIAWSADMGQSWDAIDTPARQLSCTFNQGCYAIGQGSLIQFDPAR